MEVCREPNKPEEVVRDRAHTVLQFRTRPDLTKSYEFRAPVLVIPPTDIEGYPGNPHVTVAHYPRLPQDEQKRQNLQRKNISAAAMAAHRYLREIGWPADELAAQPVQPRHIRWQQWRAADNPQRMEGTVHPVHSCAP